MANVGPAGFQSLAGGDEIENEVSFGRQVVPDPLEGEFELRFRQYMVHGIEVGGHQVNRRRQGQAADVLLQETHVQVGAVSDRYLKHLRRPVYAEDRNTPAPT